MEVSVSLSSSPKVLSAGALNVPVSGDLHGLNCTLSLLEPDVSLLDLFGALFAGTRSSHGLSTPGGFPWTESSKFWPPVRLAFSVEYQYVVTLSLSEVFSLSSALIQLACLKEEVTQHHNFVSENSKPAGCIQSSAGT